MQKFDLKKIAWKALPKKSFIAKVNGEEQEVEIKALDGQEMLELQQLAENQRLLFLLSKGLDCTMQEAQEIVKHDLNFSAEVAKNVLDLSSEFHQLMNEEVRGRSLTTTD